MTPDIPPAQIRTAAVAGCLLAAITLMATIDGGVRLGLATLVGGLAGFSLYHAAFGFTAGWRRFIRERRSGGLRMQLVLIAMTTVIAIPLIHYGDLFGVRAGGFVFPFGLAVIAGSFMFGLGMQLGGGCGSGTLFTVGGGSTRMVITLAFFILGGLLATYNFDAWQALPKLPGISLSATPAGPLGGIVLTLALLGAVFVTVRRAELVRHGDLDNGRAMGSVWHGPWSLWAGAIGLTLVGGLTLIVLGRPWGITSGLTLWGAQIANLVGVPIADWPYWHYAMGQVEASIFAGGTSVMNLGLIVGACLAAALAGRFAPKLNLSAVDVLTAMAGGLLMGYGARIAFGCNIGALLGGIASGSLHGWGWFVFAFLGSLVGVRLRERLGMDPPRVAPVPSPVLGAQS
ncbi:YeeE/YedE family protein [Acuticoccus mangrovi]|uniref:YeeE/YedE family protein n=1 Tax=Acuticoccus mangrovi TaxID=2796142 RepID=A0A934ILY5_9HYPH|nr:YeeE/YedE family protein [Acuticoccus mangrovi]MBJ3775070.1 YeeE/YedE family protein [Acuticoccus mangrovi]